MPEEYCVTGGTGLIASHLVKALLAKGYSVRATVRNPDDVEKVGFLWELEGAKQRLKLFKADLMEESGFDDAIQGVDGVFHVASPVISPPFGDNVQGILIDPTLKGTANVLRSCVKSGVLRVVLTSSSKATRCRSDLQQVSPINESHWSDIDYCKRNKTLAEKEAWKISKENGLDLVVVIPCFVVGPMLSSCPTSTLDIILSLIKGGKKGGISNLPTGFVHVDDVVWGHILAMKEKKASGRLLLCSGPVLPLSEIVEMLKAKYPNYPYENQFSANQEGVVADIYSYDTSKIIELGLPGFKCIAEMFDDCIQSFQDKGLLISFPYLPLFLLEASLNVNGEIEF
ncbi:hypothetical protein V2J09_007596 [Rumex salicifolius]